MGQRRLVSDRLMRLLLREVSVAEDWHEVGTVPDKGAGKDGAARPCPSPKERIETIGQLTRTLEKLLDLSKQEAEASGAGAHEGPEVEKLRDELVRRLKILDAKRRADSAGAFEEGSPGADAAGDRGSAPDGAGPRVGTKRPARVKAGRPVKPVGLTTDE